MLTSILGQEPAVAALQEAIRSSHLAQTYLFVGQHQIGKTTTAIGLARVLLCENRTEFSTEACGHCAACRSTDANTNPDVRSVAPTGPSKMLRIAQFWPRDGVKDHPADKAMLRDLHFGPVSGKRRIFIIESAESMNEDTANSLLKVLEEPPPYALFILTAISSQAVLPTILSRSQVLRFRAVPEPEIVIALEQRGVGPEQARVLAAYAQGRPGIAFRAASAPAMMEARNEIAEIASVTSSGISPMAAFKVADDLRKAAAKLVDVAGDDDTGSRAMVSNACDILVLWYRDLLVSKSAGETGRLLHAVQAKTLHQHALRYSIAEIERAIDLIVDVRRYITRNANAQLVTEYLMLNLLALGIRN